MQTFEDLMSELSSYKFKVEILKAPEISENVINSMNIDRPTFSFDYLSFINNDYSERDMMVWFYELKNKYSDEELTAYFIQMNLRVRKSNKIMRLLIDLAYTSIVRNNPMRCFFTKGQHYLEVLTEDLTEEEAEHYYDNEDLIKKYTERELQISNYFSSNHYEKHYMQLFLLK